LPKPDHATFYTPPTQSILRQFENLSESKTRRELKKSMWFTDFDKQMAKERQAEIEAEKREQERLRKENPLMALLEEGIRIDREFTRARLEAELDSI